MFCTNPPHTGLVYVRVQQARCAIARVVHAYIPRSCRSHKICIFMFPRISGEKNNSSNGAVPDPSFFVKGLARETSSTHCPVSQIYKYIYSNPLKPPRWPITWPRLFLETYPAWNVTLVAFNFFSFFLWFRSKIVSCSTLACVAELAHAQMIVYRAYARSYEVDSLLSVLPSCFVADLLERVVP